jgi:hypothetical protein
MVVEEVHGLVHRPFYYQNPCDCIKLLLRHLPFKNHPVWAPERKFTSPSCSQRMYLDMHTSDYWWNEQKTLPPGATLVPLICGLNKTMLTTMAGNQSAWPVYNTVSNLPKQIQ